MRFRQNSVNTSLSPPSPLWAQFTVLPGTMVLWVKYNWNCIFAVQNRRPSTRTPVSKMGHDQVVLVA